MAKAKKGTIPWWKKNTWAAFSKYIRVRDALRTTGSIELCRCCSCGKIYKAFGVGCVQAGHFIPGRKAAILFNELGVHGQCYHCNSSDLNGLKGNWPGYYEFMEKKYGKQSIEWLLFQATLIVKLKPPRLKEMRDIYKYMYEKMMTDKKLMKGESYEEYAEDVCVFGPSCDRMLWLHGYTLG